jgi:hypothetical protein
MGMASGQSNVIRDVDDFLASREAERRAASDWRMGDR